MEARINVRIDLRPDLTDLDVEGRYIRLSARVEGGFEAPRVLLAKMAMIRRLLAGVAKKLAVLEELADAGFDVRISDAKETIEDDEDYVEVEIIMDDARDLAEARAEAEAAATVMEALEQKLAALAEPPL